MDQEKIKLIVHNLELLVQCLKEEIKDTPQMNYEEVAPYIEDDDVDEYYDDKEDV